MKNEYVLLVEDNKTDELLALRAIKKSDADCRIEVARDGQEAMDRVNELGQQGDLPKLIMLDIKLPKYSGIDVLKSIRKHYRTKLLPVVMLSSSDDANDIKQSYENGANSYVAKPVVHDEYTDTVQKLWEFWAFTNKNASTQ